MRRLAVILPVTIGFILFLLFVTFGSVRLTLLVLPALYSWFAPREKKEES